MAHRHYRQKDHICIDCGAKLCTHHHAGLRGCMLEAGHIGEHHNPNGGGHPVPGSDRDSWATEDGLFINNQEDWVRLVHYLGDPNSPFKGSNAPKGQTLEDALSNAVDQRKEIFRHHAIQTAVDKKRKN